MADSAKDILVDKIKVRLGYPSVVIEMADEKIEDIVDTAVGKIQSYLPDTTFLTKANAPKIDLSEDGVVDVVRVFESPTHYFGGVSYDVDVFGIRIIDPKTSRPWIRGYQLSQLERLIDKSFKFIEGMLYIDNYRGNITIEAIKYQTYEDITDERCKIWVEGYALALTKEALGRIRSKFRPSNLPMELDGDTLLSEAASEKELLESELKEDFGFFFVSR